MRKILPVLILVPLLTSCNLWQTRTTNEQKEKETTEKTINKVTKKTIVRQEISAGKIVPLKTTEYEEEVTKEQALRDQVTEGKSNTEHSSPALDNAGGLIAGLTTGDMALGAGIGLLAKKAFSFVKGRILNPKEPEPKPRAPSDKGRRKEEDEET